MKDSEKIYAQHRKWATKAPLDKDGIVVGADLTQEWLLPWWWKHYSQFNTHPVIFVDFGMSEEMKTWCQSLGTLIDLSVADIFVAEKVDMDPMLVAEMEAACGKHFWPSRNSWFKKPLACLRSPFRRSIWIDLDCEIRGSLNGLFSFCEKRIAMAKEPFELSCGMLNYNAGVIVFKHHEKLIEKWADQSFESNHLFRGDQDVLNDLIRKQCHSINELPSIYNWSRMSKENPDAIVLHWHGPHGKSKISHQIARANLKSLGMN